MDQDLLQDPNEILKQNALNAATHLVDPLTGVAQKPIPTQLNPMAALQNAAQNSSVQSPAQKSIIPPPVSAQPAVMPAITLPKVNGIGPGAGLMSGTIKGTNSGISEPIDNSDNSKPNVLSPLDIAKNKADAYNSGELKPAVNGLYNKAKDINNPFLRVLGEIGARGAQVLNGVGSVVAPAIMKDIPGSSLNFAGRDLAANQSYNNMLAQNKTQAETDLENSQSDKFDREGNSVEPTITAKGEIVGWRNKTTGEPIDELKYTPQMTQAISATKTPDTWKPVTGMVSSITGEPLETNDKGDYRPINGSVKVSKTGADTEAEMDAKYQNLVQKQIQGQKLSPEDTASVSAYKQRKLLVPTANNVVKVEMQQKGFENQKTNQERQFSHQDVRDIDQKYVLPAESVEKSYEMANNAYNDYMDARKAGKTLPTGAESMVALSTHLATTFGNVKGSRITKDMIEKHLDARGISDTALVAIQRLTNGDPLSPDQWTGFHDLITQSRNISWMTAAKEAARKNVPVNFMPEDLKTRTINGQTVVLNEKNGQYEEQ